MTSSSPTPPASTHTVTLTVTVAAESHMHSDAIRAVALAALPKTTEIMNRSGMVALENGAEVRRTP